MQFRTGTLRTALLATALMAVVAAPAAASPAAPSAVESNQKKTGPIRTSDMVPYSGKAGWFAPNIPPSRYSTAEGTFNWSSAGVTFRGTCKNFNQGLTTLTFRHYTAAGNNSRLIPPHLVHRVCGNAGTPIVYSKIGNFGQIKVTLCKLAPMPVAGGPLNTDCHVVNKSRRGHQ